MFFFDVLAWNSVKFYGYICQFNRLIFMFLHVYHPKETKSLQPIVLLTNCYLLSSILSRDM